MTVAQRSMRDEIEAREMEPDFIFINPIPRLPWNASLKGLFTEPQSGDKDVAVPKRELQT